MNPDTYTGPTEPTQPVTAQSPRQRDPERTKHRRTRGPRAAHPPLKHTGRALARHLAANTLDGRTWIAKQVKEIRDDLAQDKGGWERCSAAEKILIERAAALSVIVQSIEWWVFGQQGVVTPDGELLSVLRKGHATHVANLARILAALGLKREPRDTDPPIEREPVQPRVEVQTP
jgi:hypothetical protein